MDVLAGGSGWAGAGLLGAVLAWLLLKHLPARDAQIERMALAHQAQIATSVAEQREEFSKTIELLVSHHSQDMVQMASAMQRDSANLLDGLKRVESAVLRNLEGAR